MLPSVESAQPGIEAQPSSFALSPGDLQSWIDSSDLEAPGIHLGLYTSSSLQVSAGEIGDVDAWLAENDLTNRLHLAGTFMDIEFPNPEWNLPHDLDRAWDEGVVPFINLAVGTTSLGPRTAQQVADGELDDAIRTWASIFAEWSQGGEKHAFIAPLQEMNTAWVSYGLDPENFKSAYAHIQELFVESGVPDEAVLWVFSPNGWSHPESDFEMYYPGDSAVEVIGFSAFNFGACVAGGEGWDPFETAIQPYLERMNAMAPEKPIFITQMGSVEEGGDRSAWFMESFAELSNAPMLRGILYFNVSKPEASAPACDPVDWRVYYPELATGDVGFLEALRVLEPGVVYGYQVFLPMATRGE